MKTWQLLQANPALFQRYFVKEYLIQAVRLFFEKRGGYHELESPILASALPQERYLDILNTEIDLADGRKLTAYLLPSTETFNKKMLAAGLGNHFVITKVFRGLEDISPNHSPEFTMLEWYELNHSYEDLMNSTEELVRFAKAHIDQKLGKAATDVVSFAGKEIDLSGTWYRFSVRELLKKYLTVELEEIITIEQIVKFAQSHDVNVAETDDWQTVFEMLFADKIEPSLPTDKPMFIYDYPKLLCPLTKTKAGDQLVCEKVELYVAGREIANGYTELLDADEQERRFLEEQKARIELGKKSIKFDHDLVDALRLGLPPVAGIGMGLDRLAMILADARSISEVNFFPGSELFD